MFLILQRTTRFESSFILFEMFCLFFITKSKYSILYVSSVCDKFDDKNFYIYKSYQNCKI